MAQPIEIFKDIKGMTRDFAVDSLPAGYLWDLVDAIPNRRGARIEQRGAWQYFGSTTYGGPIEGGYHAAFSGGQKLLINAGNQIHDVDLVTGVPTAYGSAAQTIQNGVKLNDRVYFMDKTGATVPQFCTFTAPASPMPASAPHGKVGCAYKGRLVLGGDPAAPSRVWFSRLETDTDGPPVTAAWDDKSWQGTSNEVTGLAPMANALLVFHPGSIERIRGGVPAETDSDDPGDLSLDLLTDQVGCIHPLTIVPWRENIIFADEHGVFLTDGATVRNLIELGGMGDFWRVAYGSRIPNQGISAGIFLDYLVVTVNCLVPPSITANFTVICDLNTRSWFRFSNWPATCYIPSEAAIEQSWVGHLGTNRLSRLSTMFQDQVPPPSPLPDYIDGNSMAVLASMTTGFHRLAKEEGMARLRNIFLSYHHQSFEHGISPNGLSVEYRTDPPTPEDIDMATGSVVGWQNAGTVPDVLEYSRKKLPVGKRGFGIMVRVSDQSPSRITRVYSIGVEQTSQDRAKVTS